jgi:hypothetical protein
MDGRQVVLGEVKVPRCKLEVDGPLVRMEQGSEVVESYWLAVTLEEEDGEPARFSYGCMLFLTQFEPGANWMVKFHRAATWEQSSPDFSTKEEAFGYGLYTYRNYVLEGRFGQSILKKG